MRTLARTWIATLLICCVSSQACSTTIVELVAEMEQGQPIVCDGPSFVLEDPRNTLPTISHEVLAEVWAYLEGEDDSLLERIIPDTAQEILDAAKYIDLLGKETERDSFDLRLACLLSSNGQIKTMEAFSYRLDPKLFADRDENGKTIPGKKFELYDAARYELEFVPKWNLVQQEVYRTVTDAVIHLSDLLDLEERHLILFTGTYGAGKSYQTRHHRWMPGEKVTDEDLAYGILSTDAVKRLYMALVPGVRNGQIHHEGVALRMEIMGILLAGHSEVHLILEACFSKNKSVDNQLDLARDNGLKVKIVDLDTDLETACLRILTRTPGNPVPPFEAIVSGRGFIRQARSHLIECAQQDDIVLDYELYYYEQGQLIQVADKQGVFAGQETLLERSLQSTGEVEVERVASRIITKEDCAVYGERLRPFVGRTIDDALRELSKA